MNSNISPLSVLKIQTLTGSFLSVFSKRNSRKEKINLINTLFGKYLVSIKFFLSSLVLYVLFICLL